MQCCSYLTTYFYFFLGGMFRKTSVLVIIFQNADLMAELLLSARLA